MKAFLFSAVALITPVIASAYEPRISLADHADRIAQGDPFAWDFVEGITTEVGPRQAGTEAEKRGREWAMAWLMRNGFANVADEPYMMDTWVPGDVMRAAIVAPYAQPLTIVPLGNSAATPVGGLTAEVVRFASYAELEAASADSLTGKIAFIDHAMRPTQDGSSYGFAGPARWTGPGLAASKGAVATVIRSVGTETDRTPHTGGTSFPAGVTPTPAAALSNPDADNLARMVERANGKPITLMLELNRVRWARRKAAMWWARSWAAIPG